MSNAVALVQQAAGITRELAALKSGQNLGANAIVSGSTPLMITLPNSGGGFTVRVHFVSSQKNSFASLQWGNTTGYVIATFFREPSDETDQTWIVTGSVITAPATIATTIFYTGNGSVSYEFI